MSRRQKHPPTSWNAYERGRASSFGSLESVPEDQLQNAFASSVDSTTNPVPHRRDEVGNELRHKSSVVGAFASLRQIGGVNSIDNFTKSYQRAAGFKQITLSKRDSREALGDDFLQDAHDTLPAPQSGLLRQQFEAAAAHGGEVIIDDDQNESQHTLLVPTEETRLLQSSRPSGGGSMRAQSIMSGHTPALGTSYGSISSRITQSARRRASILIQEHYEASIRAREDPDPEIKEPIYHVEQETLPDGVVIERIVGESTMPQTVFNSINVLVGIGILALPLGIRYAGWVIGLVFSTFAAATTAYTATLLSKCLDTNTGSTTYGDLAFLAFGPVGRNIVEVVFVVELITNNVAMTILFADSMNSLLPVLNVSTWKAIIAIGMMPLNYVPFRLLSVTSVVGIFSVLSIVILVITDGLIKPTSPGSLRDVATTFAFPLTWKTVPLSIGLFIAPWGGHGVFPSIYKDMRHPQKYMRALKYSWTFTYGLDISMAVVGYLMFGDFVRDEVTSNILLDKSYPRVISVFIALLVAVIPIAKIPLSNRPVVATISRKFLIDLQQMDPEARQQSQKNWRHRVARTTIPIIVNLIFLGIAIVFPDFDSIMALGGSSLCLTICVILPVLFYLKIFSVEGKGISYSERVFDWFLVTFSVILAVVGTVCAIIPKEKLGVK